MKDLAKMCLTAIVSLLAVIVCCLITSCRSIQYVPVESVLTEIQYKDRLQRDSIHVKDSVFMFVKGDTVFRDRWHTVYKDRLLRDTAYIHKTDSVQVPFPVERKLSFWESVKLQIGEIAIGVIIGLIIVIIWLIRRNK